MRRVQASELVVGKRYYIERIHPYPNQCNKFRGRHIGNHTQYDIITSSFNEVLSVTSFLAHTHTWPILTIPHQEYAYYQCSQDAVEEREKRNNEAIAKNYVQQLQEITGDPCFHMNFMK